MEKAIILKPARDRSVLLRHPWIYASAVERVVGEPGNGESVLVRNSRGEALGWAAYSPSSKIQARMWSFDPSDEICAEFFRKRIKKALEARSALFNPEDGNAYRMVHAESDGLPGLVVDRYASWLVLQLLSAGADRWRETLIDLLVAETGLRNVYERSDAEVRMLEGLESRSGLVRGEVLPDPPRVLIKENGLSFYVDPVHGHKTGFYLDQRRNRQVFLAHVAGRNVLNCFAYTGAFAVYALAGGARKVFSVDSSAEMLAIGRENVALNGLPAHLAEWQEGDVFQVLRLFRDQGKTFDVIVLDPPKFAPTSAQVERAARGYKDINLLALKLLAPGGLLFTFSCSGGISMELFQKIVAGAALDAQVNAIIMEYMHQGPDHPVALNFPEGEYLKGLVIRKQ